MDILTKVARWRLLQQCRWAIRKSYKEGRIFFSIDGQEVAYTDKRTKITKMQSVDDLAVFLWMKMSGELTGVARTNLAVFDITSKDIRQIILDVGAKR